MRQQFVVMADDELSACHPEALRQAQGRLCRGISRYEQPLGHEILRLPPQLRGPLRMTESGCTDVLGSHNYNLLSESSLALTREEAPLCFPSRGTAGPTVAVLPRRDCCDLGALPASPPSGSTAPAVP